MHFPRATAWSIGMVSLSVWAAGFAMTGNLLSGTPATLLLISPQATETVSVENGRTTIDVRVPANTGLAFIFNAEAFWLSSGESTSCLLETVGPVRNIKLDSTTATSSQTIRRPRGTLYVDIKDATVTVSIACKRDTFDMFGVITGKEMTRPYTYRINKDGAISSARSSSSTAKSSSSWSSARSTPSSSSTTRLSSAGISSGRPSSSSRQTSSVRSTYEEDSSSSNDAWTWSSSEESSSSEAWTWSSSEESSSSEVWTWSSSEESSSSEVWTWSSSEESSSSSSEQWNWSSSEETSWSWASSVSGDTSSHRSQITIAVPDQQRDLGPRQDMPMPQGTDPQVQRPQAPGCFAQDGTWITDRQLCAKEQNNIIERMRAQRQAEAQAGIIRQEVPTEARQVLDAIPVRELREEEEIAVRERMREKFLEEERLRKRKAEIVATMRDAAKRIAAAANASPSPDAQAYLTQAGTWYDSAAAFAEQENVTWENLSELTEAGKKVGNDAQQVVTLFRPAAPKPPTGLLERMDRILTVFPDAIALAGARGAPVDVIVWKYHEEAVLALQTIWPRCEADPKTCPELDRVLSPLEQASALLKQAVERSADASIKEEIEALLRPRQ